MRVLLMLVIPPLLVASAACGNGSDSSASPSTVTVTKTIRSAVTTTQTITSEQTVTVTPPSRSHSPKPPASGSPFPKGYPKVVTVASLPDQVRSWYQLDHYTKAVAIAPGVWTPLPVGATMQDAVSSGVLDGFCASVKSYERKYTPGESHGGTCW